MEWEVRVLHLVNIQILQPAQLNEDWYARHLPLPLIRYECLCKKAAITKEMAEVPPPASTEPKWRLAWLNNHPQYHIHMLQALFKLRDDVCFCPVAHVRTWQQHEELSKKQKNWLNYPSLPRPDLTEKTN
ncbi:hypothetical protein GOP47_0004637 [Adiantum capillus-veneris]|uniref:Uncharacterized protein n=1 Tax=Adiantum capillus-veneris TaxID=13818 RepID=A0A9D4V8G4_ADICA|nr:hypothetical protein GOP47_0004637 [Adiantum capillus-veneris]